MCHCIPPPHPGESTCAKSVSRAPNLSVFTLAFASGRVALRDLIGWYHLNKFFFLVFFFFLCIWWLYIFFSKDYDDGSKAVTVNATGDSEMVWIIVALARHQYKNFGMILLTITVCKFYFYSNDWNLLNSQFNISFGGCKWIFLLFLEADNYEEQWIKLRERGAPIYFVKDR